MQTKNLRLQNLNPYQISSHSFNSKANLAKKTFNYFLILFSFTFLNFILVNTALSKSTISNLVMPKKTRIENPKTVSKAHSQQSFKLSSNHTLLLELPSNWQHQINYLVKYLTPTITLTSENAQANFKALITPISIESHSIDTDADQLFSIVNNMASHMKSKKHSEIIIESLKRKNQLYYFHFEKQKTKSKDFTHIIQGGINIKGIICAFTIMSPEKNANTTQQILEILANAKKVEQAKVLI